MIPIDGQPILTAAEMRAAEERAIAGSVTVKTLMQRAGAGVAEAVRRLAAGAPVLVLCGPGNNGGDGYVAARILGANGLDVRVAASGEAASDAARQARQEWNGSVMPLAEATDAPVVVDALFGTGLSRALDATMRAALRRHVAAARLAIAVDLPSGVDTDSGADLGAVPGYALTLALGAIKPAHVLGPASALSRAVRLHDIGVSAHSDAAAIARPVLAPPPPDSHKYSRGMVAIVAGAMPGASALAAEAAARAGAGYVLLLADPPPPGLPHAIVHKEWNDDALGDQRIGAVLIGPGLGRDGQAERRLDAALASEHPLVIDGDALHLLAGDRLTRLSQRGKAILTPHAGEFAALFGQSRESKIAATRAAARRANAIVVAKGNDTVIAAPDGQVIIASRLDPWLSTAGTGDVLAGTIAAMFAGGRAAMDAAAAGVWLHAAAARRIGASFVADDLAHALTAVRAAL